MTRRPLHDWKLTPAEAITVQKTLCRRVRLDWDDRSIETVAGIDLSLRAGRARAAIVVLRFPDLTLIESATAELELAFPYVPGLLSFREGPAILSAWAKLRTLPDLLMFDGQGIAHPRGIGLAAHIGLWLERPSIGVAKSRLYGTHAEPGPSKGDVVPLRDERSPDRIIGAVLRTRDRVRPVFVSPGHRIDVPRAVDFTLRSCGRYRLPEPTRRAHRIAGGNPPTGGDRAGSLVESAQDTEVSK